MYEKGQGCTQNYNSALQWYQKGAATYHRASMAKIGAFYEHAYGVEANIDTAMEWYQRSADLGYGWSMNRIGIIYRDGLGMPKNNAKVIFYFEAAVKEKYKPASKNLKAMAVNK